MLFLKPQIPGTLNLTQTQPKTKVLYKEIKSRLLPSWAATGFKTQAAQKIVDIKLYKAYSNKMDIIRLFAIASIVWGHTLFGWQNKTFASPIYTIIQVVFMQLGRLGTINFFIISGFFFSDKLKKFSVAGYLKYRQYSLIIPWLIFICIFVAVQVCQIYSFQQLAHTNYREVLELLSNLVKAAIFHAAFWFIPVSVFAAIFLIITKRFTNKVWFGLLLFTITLFYCVNLYHGWVSVIHARSFLGYVFYMWLGVQVKNHLQLVKSTIDNISWRTLLVLIPLAFFWACLEGWDLKRIGCSDAFGSIRLSNGTLSILIFMALLKRKTIYSVKKLNPQKYVYGIYLVHSIILLEIMPVIDQFIIQHNMFGNIPLIMTFQVIGFIAVMTAAYLLTIIIKNSKAKFLIGR